MDKRLFLSAALGVALSAGVLALAGQSAQAATLPGQNPVAQLLKDGSAAKVEKAWYYGHTYGYHRYGYHHYGYGYRRHGY